MKSGDTVGTYLLEQRLGKGVTASTWLAKPAQSEENGLDEDNSASAALSAQACVLKIFDIAETSSWKPLDQFRREADILRTLNHP
ncbi:MAG: hypothetical protein KBB90_03675, partial [Spirochaetia bacterium]|nr:hypothetical protein [Spirochaetia bacterium]